MTSPRWLGLAVSAVAAVSVITAGTTALAASHPQATHSNNRQLPPSAARPVAPQAPAAHTVTHHLALAASAFAPDGLHNTADDYFNQWDPTTLSNSDLARCFNAGLQFPPNVTLKSVRFFYTAGSTAMLMILNRQDLINHTFTDLAHLETGISATAIYLSRAANIPAADATVNMSDYAYSVGVCPDGSTTFSGVIVTYTQPAS
jgi:hypothetical protein